jgi:hypothetical protein
MRLCRVKSSIGTLGALILALGLPRVAQAQQTVSSAKVISAIKRGVDYLLSQRNAKTFWEQGARSGSQEYLGETALVVESLLDVEQSLELNRLYMFKSPMKQSIAFLVSHRNNTTYAASFQANALALLPRRTAYDATLRWDANYLFHSMHAGGGYAYAWGTPAYVKRFPTGLNDWCDNSNTQYGVLGMWAADHAGLPIPARYWQIAASHWRTGQFINGSWGYAGLARTPSVTAKLPGRMATFTPAGVASLLISDEFLGAQHIGIHPIVDRNVLAGLHWINKHFDPSMNNQYMMYCYERVGLASGLQYFGGHNWYNDFARTLLRKQHPNGSWSAHFVTYFNPNPKIKPPHNSFSSVIATAYSLLILDRGLNPVFMNKLQYSRNFYAQWNARQRDVANVTSWVSGNNETPLNWQVVNFNSPVSNWLTSPILMITGHKDPKFNKQQLAELRAYVNAGGMVFCSCDGSSLTFQRAMMKYGREVVNGKYEFHRLTAKSMLLTMQPWYHIYFNMLAISNGVRDLWVISPTDMGAVWERRGFAEKKYWELPMNLYLYATGKGYLADRLHSLTPPSASGAPERTIAVGRLKYNGNWNPEPDAWPRLALLAAAQSRTQINVSTVATGGLNPHATPLLDMTGTGEFTLTALQISALRRYLHRGGMIFADAAGGHQKFTDSFTALAMKLYPKAIMRKLPPHCSIYTGANPGGTPATHVEYRRYYMALNGIRHTPEFLGIKQKGRWVIVLSPDDVTSGFLGSKTWGISGYSPKSAVALALNIVAYAAHHAGGVTGH